MTLEHKSQEASPGDDTLNVPRIPPYSPSRSFPIPIRRVQSFDASSRGSKTVSPTLSDDSFSPSSPSSPFRENKSRNERGKHQSRVASVPNLRAMRRRLSHGSYSMLHRMLIPHLLRPRVNLLDLLGQAFGRMVNLEPRAMHV